MKSRTLNFTIVICFLIALIEGIDIQAIGVAAASIKQHFALDSAQLGLLFSIGIFGLLPGTVIGGYYADKIGRKKVLIAAVLLFAVFTLAIVFVQNFIGLLMVRFLAGLGFGAALPNLIALASESSSAENKGKAVGMMYCGMPIGAILISLWAAMDSSENWKLIFYVGGIIPLIIVPFMIKYLSESKEYNQVKKNTQTVNYARALFNDRQRLRTFLLWGGCFFTAMVLYIMLSWLPSLFVELGFTKQQGSMAQVYFQTGATIGTLLFTGLIDKWNKSAVIAIVYIGILIGIVFMNVAPTLMIMYVAAAFTGFFLIGSNGVSYAFSSFVYPTEHRGQGVGAANAVGRVGAMVGPAIAGLILNTGGGTSGVLLSMFPCIVIALLCMFVLARKIETKSAFNFEKNFSKIE
ncbi:3-(3-hydroxy-phenyl)propionate transporter MhpT [Acinetobacter sp. YH12145]|uniref:3-(3-hydroxy-phenyl)propionate transporter MhpT n=1 Tax=Acinetobacter sp. YH12145 TaxID=2601129 RepID=UPI0015D1B2BB|nr:3-(3-hydroxy-phenyl)propionate transporter MhpT [Acinetobacter sp. YH12145]